MPEYLSPGVYVEEEDSGSKSVEGVSTSTVGFLGQTERGKLQPQLVTDFNDFKRKYGGLIDESFLGHAVKGFFENGGSRAFIARVTDRDRNEVAKATLTDEDGNDVLGVKAIGPGDWGNSISVTVTDPGTSRGWVTDRTSASSSARSSKSTSS
jgi:phage tail sheath protein FI